MIWWLLIAAVPTDHVGESLPLYLTEDKVGAVLNEAVGPLATCPTGDIKQATVNTSLRVTGEGVVAEVTLSAREAVQGSLLDCWSAGLKALVFPDHGEPEVEVRFSLYLREGRLALSPQVELPHRPIGPVLFFLSPLATTAEQARAAQRLGRPGDAEEPK